MNSFLKLLVDGIERHEQPFASLVIEAVDALTQPLDRLDEIVALAGQFVMLRFDFAQLFFGAQIDRAEALAFALDAVQPGLDIGDLRRFSIGFDLGEFGHRRGLDVELIADLVLDVGDPARRRAIALFGARRLGAGFADGFERNARGFVGFGQIGFGLRQIVGRRAAFGCCAFDFTDQGLTLLGEALRRGLKFGPLGSCLFGALSDRGDLGRRVVLAFAPGHPFGGDRLQAAAGEFGVAGDRLRLDADLRKGSAIFGNDLIDARQPGFEFVGGRQRSKGGLSFFASRNRFVAARDDPLTGFLERRNARRIAADLTLGGGMLLARRIGRMLRLAPVRARLDFRGRRGRSRCLGRFERPKLGLHLAAGVCKIALDRLQAAALGEPARRTGRRMGSDGEAVPPPEVTLARYEPLPGPKQHHEARSVGALDDADLGEAAGELRRRLDIARQGRGAFRQHRVGRVDRGARPAHGCGFIDRRIEIVAQRGAERLLVAFFDDERIHDGRPEILVLDRKQLADRLGLGFEALHLPFRVGERAARRVDLFAGVGVGGFRRVRRTFCFGERGLGGRHCRRRVRPGPVVRYRWPRGPLQHW